MLVFAEISCGLSEAILAEFAPVPNAPSDVVPVLDSVAVPVDSRPEPRHVAVPEPTEIGGPTGPEPTRFGDWEKNGRCVDF
jgi:hypothetical protein